MHTMQTILFHTQVGIMQHETRPDPLGVLKSNWKRSEGVANPGIESNLNAHFFMN